MAYFVPYVETLSAFVILQPLLYEVVVSTGSRVLEIFHHFTLEIKHINTIYSHNASRLDNQENGLLPPPSR